jgi:hypothetical protein
MKQNSRKKRDGHGREAIASSRTAALKFNTESGQTSFMNGKKQRNARLSVPHSFYQSRRRR